MKSITIKSVAWGAITLIWVGSVLLIMAPSIGLATPVFPRPQSDIPIIMMLISGALLVINSLKTGISFLRSN